MTDRVAYAHGFMAPHAFEAEYSTLFESQTVVLELRRTADEGSLLYAEVDGKPIRTTSIWSFMLEMKECVRLSIPHQIRLTWVGKPTKARIVENFSPAKDRSSFLISLSLEVGTESYETSTCDTLTEALMELEEIIPQGRGLQLQVCYDCRYSLHAFPWPGNDREDLRCFRDDAETFAKLSSSAVALSHSFGGHYFVNAFHSCAAWRPRDVSAGTAQSTHTTHDAEETITTDSNPAQPAEG